MALTMPIEVCDLYSLNTIRDVQPSPAILFNVSIADQSVTMPRTG